jgi:uncharacterized membrane protein
MSRVYKIRKLGHTMALAIPKVLVSQEMLDKGVVIQVLDYSPEEMTLKVRVANERNRKHVKNNKSSRTDPQKLGTSSDIQ